MLLNFKILFIVSFWPIVVLADQCVLQDKTVSRSQVYISEITQIKSTVVPEVNGQKKCLVNLRGRVGSTWYTGFGEHTWDGARPRDESCGIAAKRAQDSIRESAGASKIVSEKVLICNDQPDLKTLRETNPGTVGDLAQFRPNSGYPKEFWHNGAKCRIFLDSSYTNKDIKTFSGVICQLQDSKWVVVDKF